MHVQRIVVAAAAGFIISSACPAFAQTASLKCGHDTRKLTDPLRRCDLLRVTLVPDSAPLVGRLDAVGTDFLNLNIKPRIQHVGFREITLLERDDGTGTHAKDGAVLGFVIGAIRGGLAGGDAVGPQPGFHPNNPGNRPMYVIGGGLLGMCAGALFGLLFHKEHWVVLKNY